MTSIRWCGIAVGLLAGAAFAIQAAAQATSSQVLTNLEVGQLIARGEPADHTRLRGHFTALADQFETEARQYDAMARAIVQDPGERWANRSSDHLERLESLAMQSAATVRQLAAHHGRLAGGISPTAPENGARVESDERPRVTSEHNKTIHELAANLGRAADHRVIAEHFERLEKQYNAAVNEHAAMAQTYRAVPDGRGEDPAAHCDRLVRLSREAANEAAALAAEHKQAAAATR